LNQRNLYARDPRRALGSGSWRRRPCPNVSPAGPRGTVAARGRTGERHARARLRRPRQRFRGLFPFSFSRHRQPTPLARARPFFSPYLTRATTELTPPPPARPRDLSATQQRVRLGGGGIINTSRNAGLAGTVGGERSAAGGSFVARGRVIWKTIVC
jgi:hypothetical protein